MHRRRFLAHLLAVPTAGYAVVSLVGCGTQEAERSRLADDPQHPAPTGSIQSFAYYQGLGPNETRSPSRSDGTDYEMPCITAEEIAAGVEKTFDFWHGHSRRHKFTVTAEHLLKLQNGEALEIFTDVVDGHRHALAIKPTSRCSKKSC